MPSLASGYLRLNIESDRVAWAQRSSNMGRLYEANQHLLARRTAEAGIIFARIDKPEFIDEQLLYWCCLSRLHGMQGACAQELEGLEKASAIEIHAPATERACFALRRTAILRSQHRNHEALQQVLLAESYLKHQGNDIVLGFVRAEVGLCLLRLGDVAGATRCLIDAYRTLSDHIGSEQLATLGISLAVAHQRISEYQQARVLLEEIVSLGSQSIGPRNFTTSRFALATTLHQLHDCAAAIDQYEDLLEDDTAARDPSLYVQLLGSLGDAYCSAGLLDKASQILQTDSAIIQSAPASAQQTLIGTFGKIYAALGDHASARTAYRNALNIVRNDDLPIRHRLLLEDLIASGCLQDQSELLAAYKELADVIAQQHQEQSAIIASTATSNTEEIRTGVLRADARRNEELWLISQAQHSATHAIGSHLHATTLQELTLLRMRIEGALVDSAHLTSNDIEEDLHWLYEQTMRITDELRDFSHVLHQHNVTGDSITTGLRSYAQHLQQSAIGRTVVFSTQGAIPVVSDGLAQSLYRCVQLCAQNALQHSGCTCLTIDVQHNNNVLRITVTDDGCGFDVSSTNFGIGLRELQSRVSSMFGEVVIRSKSQHGTTVILSIPTGQVPAYNKSFSSTTQQ